jgi:DNA-binding transcriptional MerR regulator
LHLKDPRERPLASVPASQPLFSISEVARLVDVSPSAIVKAERKGRISVVAREVGGDDRIFRLEDIARVRAYFRR